MTPTFYHGTRTPFTRGGLLLPAETTRARMTPGLVGARGDEGQWVYVTTERALAIEFALLSRGRGKPRILTVRPLGGVQADPALFGGVERPAFRCEAAYVEAVEFVTEQEALEVL